MKSQYSVIKIYAHLIHTLHRRQPKDGHSEVARRERGQQADRLGDQQQARHDRLVGPKFEHSLQGAHAETVRRQFRVQDAHRRWHRSVHGPGQHRPLIVPVDDRHVHGVTKTWPRRKIETSEYRFRKIKNNTDRYLCTRNAWNRSAAPINNLKNSNAPTVSFWKFLIARYPKSERNR